MRAQHRWKARLSRNEIVANNEALLKADFDCLVHEASTGIRRGFGRVGKKCDVLSRPWGIWRCATQQVD